MYPNNDQKLM